MGALLGHLTAAPRGNRFQPANMSFALFPPLERPSRDNKDRRGQILQLAREEMSKWLNRHDVLFSGRTDLSPGLT